MKLPVITLFLHIATLKFGAELSLSGVTTPFLRVVMPKFGIKISKSGVLICKSGVATPFQRAATPKRRILLCFERGLIPASGINPRSFDIAAAEVSLLQLFSLYLFLSDVSIKSSSLFTALRILSEPCPVSAKKTCFLKAITAFSRFSRYIVIIVK